MDDLPDAFPSPTTELTPAELAAWQGFLQAHAALSRGLDADLRAAHGLPLTEFEVLLWLAGRPCERARMATLAESVLLTPSGLSRAVARLEGRGLVQRIQCSEDRRGSFAVLTDAGIALVGAARVTHAASIRQRFLGHLSPAEQRQLAAIWSRIPAERDAACAGAPAEACCGAGWADPSADPAPHTRRLDRP